MSLGKNTIGQILAANLGIEDLEDIKDKSPEEQRRALYEKTIVKGKPFVDRYEALLLIALFKLSKTPEGLKVINNLGGKFIDGLFASQKAMCATAAGNDITAWGAPVIQSAIFERFGIVPPGFNSQFHLGLSMLAGADFIEDIASSITGMFSFSRTAAPDKIQSITYTEAPRTDYQQEIETGEVK